MKSAMKALIFILCSLQTLNAMSQQVNTSSKHKPQSHAAKTYNTLYQYGTAESFVGGLFEATLPMKALKEQGDFGIGAPGLLDGELVISEGHAYQTHASGKTAEVQDSFKAALAFVTFFKADTSFHISASQNQNEALAQLEQYLTRKNAAYAIRISGKFNHLKTRAFPPYTQKPYPPLATLLDKQHFFNISNTNGVIIGYKLPPYLNGLSVEGYHFHFLSADKSQGGHVLDFSGADLTVEIAKIKDFHLSIPQDDDFMNYNFKANIHNDLEKVKKGQ